MSNIFPKIMKYENPWGHKKKWEWISRQIKKYRIKTVIDIGCGAGGYLTIPLMIDNPDVLIQGLDYSEKSIFAAKRAADYLTLDKDAFIQDSIYNVTSKYECVICSEVLEHIDKEELLKFINKLKDMVSDGGYLIITVPNGKGTYEKGVSFRRTEYGRALLNKIAFLFGVINRLLFRNMIKEHTECNDLFKMTESDSEHVNFFLKQDILGLFYDLTLLQFDGSNRFSGCIIPLIPQFTILTRFNNWLGSKNPDKAADFYFLFKKDN